ncbi:MAG: stage II sporulation protein M [Methanoregula sp.]|nr:MAG: stage II sporulation protein M [Methanoregula sp.]
MSEPGLGRAVVIIFLLFFTTILIGWVGTAQNPEIGEEFMHMFQKDVAKQVMGGSDAEIGGKIFLNNIEACILLFLGGASFGIFTILIMSLNGIVIGAIMEIVHEQHSSAFVAAAILPHGIFEIPGFILAGALGILLSQSLVNEYYGSGDAAAETERLTRNFMLMVLPLIAVAAVVEAFITPQVIQLVV